MLDNKSYTKPTLLLFIIVFIIIIIFLSLDERKNLNKVLFFINSDENIIDFNYENGIYNKSLKIKLKLNNKIPSSAKIYYTINGNTPNKKSNFYKNPITLEKADEEIRMYDISAIIYYKGKYSKVERKSYVLTNKNIDIPVINIGIDEDDLYNTKYGLFANRNIDLRDKEDGKEANLTIIENDTIINQDVKLLVSGAGSKIYDVKSLKIIANYDNNNGYLDFSLSSNSSNISQLIKYKTIRLSSNGQDQEYSFLRNSVIQKLAYESNFSGYKDIKRSIVFINGKYYGFMNIEQTYSDYFIKNRYALQDNEIEKYKLSENEIIEKLKLNKILKNINNPNNIKNLESKIDMDDLLLYYAIEFIVNNSDWPLKNLEIWKYNGTEVLNNKYSDGRYRFLLYDLDLSYFTEETSLWKDFEVGVNKFEEEMKNKESLFYKLMKSDYYRNKFITIVNNLLNTSFSEENVTNSFTEEYNKIMPYLNYYKTDNSPDYEKHFIETIEIVEKRDNELNDDLRKYLNAKHEYNIEFKTDNGAMINIENINIYNNSNITYYYTSNEVLLKGMSCPGYDFKYFIVNGEKVEDDEIIISSESTIEAVSEKNDNNLIITELKSKSDDYIILTNISNKEINLSDYYISDKKKNLKKYNLPNKKLKSNQSIIIFGKTNLETKIGDYIASFNFKANENLYVYNSKKDRIENQIVVPKLNKKEIYYRVNNSNQFKIKLQK